MLNRGAIDFQSSVVYRWNMQATKLSIPVSTIALLLALSAYGMELPIQSCFSVTPKGEPELSVFVMENTTESAGSPNHVARLKFGSMGKNDETPEGISIPLSASEKHGSVSSYRANGFSLEIDSSRKDPNSRKMIFGRLSLDSSLHAIDPQSGQPANFKDKTVQCLKTGI